MLSRTGCFLAAILLSVGLSSPAAATANGPYILVDADSGQILASRLPHQLWHPASVTKLMTAYVLFEQLASGALTPTSAVKISARALAEPPSKMGYAVGTTMTVDNALKMMLVHSANDIAVAIAETVSGSEAAFVARMNATADRLGMINTHYNNPNGLPDDGQVTTARDLAVLSRALWRDFPQYRELFAIPAIKAGKRVLRNYNTLIDRYQGSNGLKTGFICSSGYNLVASATRDSRTMIAVVLGATNSTDRAEQAARLLDKGFNGINLFKSDLAASREASPQPVVDMRDQVCGKRKRPEDGEGEGEVASASVLGPRFKVADPVVVTTGLPGDPPAKAIASKPAAKDKKPEIVKANAAATATDTKKTTAKDGTAKDTTTKDATPKVTPAKDAVTKDAGKTGTGATTTTPAKKPATKPEVDGGDKVKPVPDKAAALKVSPFANWDAKPATETN